MSAPARLLPALAYAAAAAWVLRGAVGRAVGEGVDLPGTLWYHAWIADCVRHLRWPAWTPWFFHPDGKDLFAHTGANLLDALLAVPFLWALGSPDHVAPFVAVVLVGNALAVHALLRALGVDTPGAVAGGLVFLLAPSALAELDGGRITQVLLWFWPLALRELWLDRVDPRPWRPVRAGVLVALQAWTYWFTGHFFAVVFGAPLLLLAVVPSLFLGRGAGPPHGRLAAGLRGRAASPPRLAGAVPRSARAGDSASPSGSPATPPALSSRSTPSPGRALARLAFAGGVAALAVAPAVVPMLLRLAEGTVPIGAGLVHAAPDALSPDAWWILAPDRSQLHVPYLALAVFGAGLLGARRRLFWGLAALLGVLLVAGARLHFAFGAAPNPVWELASLLPGFERLLFPARAWSALALVGAVAVGEAVDRLGRAGWVGAAVATAALLVARGEPVRATPIEVPAYVAAVAAAPGPVLDLPFPCGQLVIHLQPLHGQPLLGGMAEHLAPLRPPAVDARLAADPGLRALVDAGLGRAGGPVDPAGLAAAGARWVVLHEDVLRSPLAPAICLRGAVPTPGAPRRALERLLGPPTIDDVHAVAWDLGVRN